MQDRGTWHDMSQGAIEQTGNPLDVAIDGNAFLAVQTPRGERYTRNGALQINAAGQLVTSDGYPGARRRRADHAAAHRPATSRSASDGTVSVREGATPRSIRSAASCVSSRFDQPQRLQKDGGSTFIAPAGVDPRPRRRAPRASMQGALEKSNVRGVVEMTRMIEITRTYTQVATLLQQQSDMRKHVDRQARRSPELND